MCLSSRVRGSLLATKPPCLVLLIGITIIAAGVRFYLLGEKAIWWDEGWSLYLARKPLAEIIRESAITQHPPLHYLYLHYWIKLIGESEFAARLSSAFFGIATVPAVFVLGRRIGGFHVGLGASVFIAVSPFHVQWSQEVRMYSAATFFGAVSLFFALDILSRPSWLRRLAFVLSTGAMLYLHYGTGLLVLAENLIFFISMMRRERVRRLAISWVTAQAAVLAIVSPWLLFFLRHSVVRTASPALTPLEYIELVTSLLPLNVSAYVQDHLWSALPFAIIALLGAVTLARGGSKVEWHVALAPTIVLIAIVGLLYVLSLPAVGPYSPRIEDRYLLVLVPAYAITLAGGVVYIGRRWWPAGIGSALLLSVLVGIHLNGYLSERYMVYDVAALGRLVSSHFKNGDAVVLNPDNDWPVYAYYLGQSIPLTPVPYGEIMTPDRAAYWLRSTVNASTVWLIETRNAVTTDSNGSVREFLTERFPVRLSRDFGESRLTVFSVRDDNDLWDVGYTPADNGWRIAGLVAAGSGLGPRRVRAGFSLYAWELWRADTEKPWARARLVLQSESGVTFVTSSEPLALRDRTAGRSVYIQQRLGIPLSAKPGIYSARVEVLSDDQVIGVVPLGNVSVETISLPVARRAEGTLVGAIFANGVMLERVVLPSVVPLGSKARVWLYWSASSSLDTSYTVFVHISDQAGRVVAQHDGLPAGGSYPTLAWAPGETISDWHEISFNDQLEPGEYTVTAGLYDSFTGQRVGSVGGVMASIVEDAVVLGKVRVDQ